MNKITGRSALPIDADWLIMRIVDALPDDAIVVDEGVTASRLLLSFLPFRDRYGYHGLASGGIGWGIAAAVGVQIAQPARPVLAVIGDGSATTTDSVVRWCLFHKLHPA